MCSPDSSQTRKNVALVNVVIKQLQESETMIICPLQALEAEGRHVRVWVFCRTAHRKLELLFLLLAPSLSATFLAVFFGSSSSQRWRGSESRSRLPLVLCTDEMECFKVIRKF